MFTADVSQDPCGPAKMELLKHSTKRYTRVPGGVSKLQFQMYWITTQASQVKSWDNVS